MVVIILGFIIFISIFILCILLMIALISYQQIKREDKVIEHIEKLVTGSRWYEPEEFLDLRVEKKAFNNRSRISTDYNLPGIYILHNVSEDLHYVGQSIRVLDRAAAHFMGRGHGDVYADYKYGRRFRISIILLENTQYSSLDELERDAILTFKAYNKGYNRTRGNSTKIY